LKTKDALSRDFKGGSLRSHLFSTTPLASFLGSPSLLFQAELSKLGKKLGLCEFPSLVKEGWLRHK